MSRGPGPGEPVLPAVAGIARPGDDSSSTARAAIDRWIGALPSRPRLLALGAESGTLFCRLAPQIGRAQVWTVLDADPAALEALYAATAEWCVAQSLAVSWPGRAMLVHTPGGAWRLQGLLADRQQAAMADADALLWRATEAAPAAWIAQLAAQRQPLLISGIATGLVVLRPRHPSDRMVLAPLHRRSGGVGAPARIARLLGAAGFDVRIIATNRRIGRSALAALRGEISEIVASSAAHSQTRAKTMGEWEQMRLRQALAGRLSIEFGQADLLALPAAAEISGRAAREDDGQPDRPG